VCSASARATPAGTAQLEEVVLDGTGRTGAGSPELGRRTSRRNPGGLYRIGCRSAGSTRELDISARGVNVSESPAMADRYANLRAELWDLTKQWFNEEVQIPNDDSLIADLTAPRYSFNSVAR
jgi:hypothetical protein